MFPFLSLGAQINKQINKQKYARSQNGKQYATSKRRVFKIISWWWKVVCIKLKSFQIHTHTSALIISEIVAFRCCCCFPSTNINTRTHRHHQRIYFIKCNNKLLKKPKVLSLSICCARVYLFLCDGTISTQSHSETSQTWCTHSSHTTFQFNTICRDIVI